MAVIDAVRSSGRGLKASSASGGATPSGKSPHPAAAQADTRSAVAAISLVVLIVMARPSSQSASPVEEEAGPRRDQQAKGRGSQDLAAVGDLESAGPAGRRIVGAGDDRDREPAGHRR